MQIDVLSTSRPTVPTAGFEMWVEQWETKRKKKGKGKYHIPDRCFNPPCFDWARLSQSVRQAFVDVAKKKLENAAYERRNYVPVSCWFQSEDVKKKNTLVPIDPYRPMYGIGDCGLFSDNERNRRLSSFIPAGGARNPFRPLGDLMVGIQNAWEDADLHTKLRYEDMARKDSARFDMEMEEYQKAKIVDKVNNFEDAEEEP